MRRWLDESGGAKAWILATIIALPLSLAGLIGLGCALGANSCPFTESTPIATTDGGEIWLARCALCHGLDANGTEANPDAPSLVEGELAGLTLEELMAKISRGRPLAGMPRFENSLTDEQLENVARYVLRLRGEPDAGP